jgi:hypothetical protein
VPALVPSFALFHALHFGLRGHLSHGHNRIISLGFVINLFVCLPVLFDAITHGLWTTEALQDARVDGKC